jgi:hypothetical protein
VLRRGATPPPRELTARRALVTGEVALAFVLLACVTLLGGSLLRLLKVDPGSTPVVCWRCRSLPAASYNAERVVSFYSALQGALEERLDPDRSRSSTKSVDRGPGRIRVSARKGDIEREAVVREAGPPTST